MFSGIVEEIGTIHQACHTPDKTTITIQSSLCWQDLNLGDSISVNGICLTVCHKERDLFTLEAMPETVRLTTIGTLKANDPINLERALKANSRIGGHMVQGHIDGTTQISHVQEEGCALKVWFHRPTFHPDCLIPKGFIAIDGMSLTLVDITDTHFSVCLIPHTRSVTISGRYDQDMAVNVEIDHITKTILSTMKSINQGEHHGHH